MSGDYIPPNVPLYLTPDSIPVGRFCRQLQVPDSPEWVGLVDGVLSTLFDPMAWRKFGTLTPEEAAEQWYSMVAEAWEIEGCGAGLVPTPFWDDVTDTDDEAEPAAQDWYGVYDGDFTAQLADWTIAGFIAATGNIGGAIFFTTIAPKFRLAWKTGDVGGIVRVFVDSADYGTVDTYSDVPGIIEKDYIADPEETEHAVLIVLEELHDA